MNRRKAELPNYSTNEGRCACGCGFKPTDACMVAHQAFHDILERKIGAKIRHIISGGARCRKHNESLIARGIKAAKDSQHLYGKALDGIWETRLGSGTWIQIDNEVIAFNAVSSGLFNGVGHVYYKDHGQNLVHLDIRDGPKEVW